MKEQIQHLITCLENSKHELQILCKDGYVSIYPDKLYSWTYAGMFGSWVKSVETNNRIEYDNMKDRLTVLQTVMNQYSSEIAGINIITC